MHRMKTREWRVARDQAGVTLQDFLAHAMGLSRNRAKALIDQRQVFINGRRVWMARHTLKPNDVVEGPASAPPATPASAPMNVLLDDEHYVIVDKPAGRLANGPDSAETALRDQLQAPGLRAAHRLDRDTSGCLLLARDDQAFDAVVEEFKAGKVLKVYHALVAGRVSEAHRTINRPLDNEPAVTHLQVLDSNDLASHLRLKIDTGRTHQIRLHMLRIGHPLLGERNYGQRLVPPPEVRHVERQMLHAAAIQFESPLSKRVLRAEAPLPADFERWLKILRLT
jgi:23S rRNA pseudouridine1911/1915/1917 synthase